MMKILVVTPLFVPAWKFGGGVLSTLHTLCRALVEKNSVTVYTTNASGSDKPLDVITGKPVNKDGVTIYYFKSTFGPTSVFHSVDLIKYLHIHYGSIYFF